MGVKYTIPFKGDRDTDWRVDIAITTFATDTITLRGVGRDCVDLAYDAETTDDPFSVLIPSTLTVQLYNQDDIDVRELQQLYTKDCTISLYRDGLLYWTGYLVSDGIQRPLITNPTKVTLQAKCGLSMLEKMPYVHADLPGLTFDISRCPMNYIRQILFANLGLTMPIKWTNNLVNSAYLLQDVFAGSVQWATDNEGFYSYQSGQSGDEQGPVKTCGYILSGILASMQCRIFQAGGKWVIRRIPDTVSGAVLTKEITGDFGILLPTVYTENLINQIARDYYPFVKEDQIMTNKPGLKSVKVEYNQNVRENILPNGKQDMTDGISPLFWGDYADILDIHSADSLDGRDGFATHVINFSADTHYYTLVANGGSLGNNGLPIDTKTMIKRLSFGFTFSPHGGYPFDPSTQVINWSTNPFQIQVIFNLNGTKYYLNEFGFWVTVSTWISITVDGLRIDDVARIDFDRFQGILMPTDGTPVKDFQSDIVVTFRMLSTQNIILDNIYITIDGGNDVYESSLTESRNTETDERQLDVSSAYGGYILNNFQTSWETSDTECFYQDAAVYEGTLTGLTANAIMRNRYKSSEVYNGSMYVGNSPWTFDQIYMIETLNDLKFLPMNANFNPETCIVHLVAIESRNDNVILVEKYYSSNDSQLSN
jgi:hypothetical protein